jgi:hypothetical protein
MLQHQQDHPNSQNNKLKCEINSQNEIQWFACKKGYK